MAENPTHLEIHTGLTKQFRAQAAAPTDPAPESGDVYVDNTAGVEAVGIYRVTGWVYISLKP
jgi:hypothetical protein